MIKLKFTSKKLSENIVYFERDKFMIFQDFLGIFGAKMPWLDRRLAKRRRISRHSYFRSPTGKTRPTRTN